MIAGYCVSHDVSERHFQLERGGQWDKGKSCETFNPLGPWLVTADEVADPQQLDLWLNGQRRGPAGRHDRNMIFPVLELVHYLSQFMVLEPGDVVNTGTPAGVGLGMQPPPTSGPAMSSSSASRASARSGSPSSRPRELPPRSGAERLAGVGRGLLALRTRR